VKAAAVTGSGYKNGYKTLGRKGRSDGELDVDAEVAKVRDGRDQLTGS
jgi:hypothetical protein